MKKNYQKPKIELLKVRVEKGFAGSGLSDKDVRPGHGYGDHNHVHTGHGNGYKFS